MSHFGDTAAVPLPVNTLYLLAYIYTQTSPFSIALLSAPTTPTIKSILIAIMTTTHQKVCGSVSLGVLPIPGAIYIPLEEKIAALAQAGFEGIDVYMWGPIPFAQ